MRPGRLPLTALRSFEAAGRHLSFTRAAEELLVSQAAVSRQVRDLEAGLGRPLFERRHRQVVLTSAGRQLLDQLTTSFDQIDRLLGQLRAGPAATILPVSVEPSFASCWLVPRLDDFHRRHPTIDVDVASEARLIDFRGQDAALAIRYAATDRHWRRLEARHLADVVMKPVLSPDLLAANPGLKKPGDLRHLTLLHERDRDNWASWFRLAGQEGPVPKRGPLYADIALAMQAALRGHGVALVDTILAADEIATGRLVQPFPQGLKLGAYWLVAPALAALSPPAQAFADWLTDAIRQPRAPNKAMRKSKRPSASGARSIKTGARRQSTA